MTTQALCSSRPKPVASIHSAASQAGSRTATRANWDESRSRSRPATAPSVQSMSPLGQCSARLKICATSAMPAPRATVPTACNATASP